MNGEERENGRHAVGKWLRTYLTRAGRPVSYQKILRDAIEEGFSKNTLYRAWASLRKALKKEGIPFTSQHGLWGIGEEDDF